MTNSTPSPVSTVVAGGRTFKVPYLDAMPPLATDELERLRDDIQAHGIKVPVLVTEDDVALDGHHRLTIAAELGLTAEQIPIRVEAGLTAQQKRHLAVSLNLHRRHLTREQVQQKIADLLKADSEQSDRAIAGRTNVDHKTVGRARARLTASGAVPRTDTVKGKDGRRRTRPPVGRSGTPARRPSASAKAAPVLAPPGTAEVLPRQPVSAPRRDAKWAELVVIAFYLKDISAAVGRLAKCKVASRIPAPVREQVQRLTSLLERLEDVAASHQARTSSA